MSAQAVRGRVLRIVGGFYRVAIAEGKVIECRIAGRLKRKEASDRRLPRVLPGDIVRLEEAEGAMVIRAVEPRSTCLVRPLVANVNICVVVQSAANPPPNAELIDRLLAQAQSRGLAAAICLTKADLATDAEAEAALAPYRAAGFKCLVTSAQTGRGINELAELLAGKVSILAGQSGVGKSRLLNALCPDFQRKTGEVSEKIARGRHTTRHVELLPLPQGGWVADSPGFSALDLAGIAAADLAGCYPEFREIGKACKYSSCLHRGEPGCAVAGAVALGEINKDRYARYLRFVKEIEEQSVNRY